MVGSYASFQARIREAPWIRQNKIQGAYREREATFAKHWMWRHFELSALIGCPIGVSKTLVIKNLP